VRNDLWSCARDIDQEGADACEDQLFSEDVEGACGGVRILSTGDGGEEIPPPCPPPKEGGGEMQEQKKHLMRVFFLFGCCIGNQYCVFG
jgi:hypothetical protein